MTDRSSPYKPGCGTCRFKRDGKCKRRSPQVKEATFAGITSTRGAWPAVSDDDWCGEWEPKS